MQPLFSELTEADLAIMDRQRDLVRRAAIQCAGFWLSGTGARAEMLQRLIDEEVFAGSQLYELQALGVAFGDILCDEGPFRWVIIEDEYGRDPTLRWKDTSMNINALTMLSKRVERGERPDVQFLLNTMHKHCAENEGRVE